MITGLTGDDPARRMECQIQYGKADVCIHWMRVETLGPRLPVVQVDIMEEMGRSDSVHEPIRVGMEKDGLGIRIDLDAPDLGVSQLGLTS